MCERKKKKPRFNFTQFISVKICKDSYSTPQSTNMLNNLKEEKYKMLMMLKLHCIILAF